MCGSNPEPEAVSRSVGSVEMILSHFVERRICRFCNILLLHLIQGGAFFRYLFQFLVVQRQTGRLGKVTKHLIALLQEVGGLLCQLIRRHAGKSRDVSDLGGEQLLISGKRGDIHAKVARHIVGNIGFHRAASAGLEGA